MQKMMTKEIEQKAPRLYETDGQGMQAVAVAHFFSWFNNYDWYLTEYDPATGDAFGFVKSPACYGMKYGGELGYFNIHEFEQINKKHGIEVIERETYFTPCKLSEIR